MKKQTSSNIFLKINVLLASLLVLGFLLISSTHMLLGSIAKIDISLLTAAVLEASF